MCVCVAQMNEAHTHRVNVSYLEYQYIMSHAAARAFGWHQYFGASLEVVYKKTYVCVK